MVRSWTVPPSILDQRRLSGEHVENHIIVNVILRMYQIADDQECLVEDIDYTDIKLGWRSHPQVKRWIGRVGALIERHDQLAKEMSVRKAEKHGNPQLLYDPHASPMSDQVTLLTKLDPWDKTYGKWNDFAHGHPDLAILDLRHLFEKWERDEAAGRPPKDHDPDSAYTLLVTLVGDADLADKLMMEKLLT